MGTRAHVMLLNEHSLKCCLEITLNDMQRGDSDWIHSNERKTDYRDDTERTVHNCRSARDSVLTKTLHYTTRLDVRWGLCVISHNVASLRQRAREATPTTTTARRVVTDVTPGLYRLALINMKCC